MTFWELQRFINTGEPEPHSFGDISRYAADPVPDSAITAIVDLLAACPSRSADANGSIWSLGWVGGAVVNACRPQAGQRVVVAVVGLGGVRMAAVLTALALDGVEVIGVDGVEDKLPLATDLGEHAALPLCRCSTGTSAPTW